MQSKRHARFFFLFPLLLSFPELGPGTRHFSKSHERRMKRKVKEQLAGNTMDDLQTALATLDKDIVPPESMDKSSPAVPIHSSEVKPKAISSIVKIGKGNSSTLSKAERKRLLSVLRLSSDDPKLTIIKSFRELERLRHPLILANPDFTSNPFQTIRTHAQNTLISRDLSS